jgi:hypothetical protein
VATTAAYRNSNNAITVEKIRAFTRERKKETIECLEHVAAISTAVSAAGINETRKKRVRSLAGVASVITIFTPSHTIHSPTTFILKQFSCVFNVRTTAVTCGVAITGAFFGFTQFITCYSFIAWSAVTDVTIFTFNALCVIFANRITDPDVTIIATPTRATRGDIDTLIFPEGAIP